MSARHPRNGKFLVSAPEHDSPKRGTNDRTNTERRAPAPQPTMTGEEREAIRQAGAEDARRSRIEHGFPERIEDPVAVAMFAAFLRDIPTPGRRAKAQAMNGNQRHRGNHGGPTVGSGQPFCGSRINQNGFGLRGGLAVEVRISCAGEDRATDLESLSDWFRAEPELGGRLRAAGPMPGEGELGALADVLVVAVGSGGTLSVLMASLKAWLAQPRRSDVRIRIQQDGGEMVEIDARRIDDEHVDALIRQALGGRLSGK